ncbi:MAG: hypothetical protein GKS07_01520 [Nitrosopumilus sp.]|nr:MAG: hypothetical protein GKS07_01520 [Nitrosopumilus sp.]
MNNFVIKLIPSERPVTLPNVDFLLKVSLGFVLLAMISFALVYAETISVDIEGNSFDVDYDVTGITVDAIASDVEASSLYLTITANSSGTLDVTFDRMSFDSIFEGLDEEFFVLIDGDFATYSEIETNTQSRTLSIEVPSGSEEVEIIGTVFGDPESSVISDKAAADKAAADKAAADKAAADKAAADKAAADKAAADKAAADKAAADKAAADKAAAVNTTQSTQCGPGTILQNGACVLDERCGPGTILKDNACVLDFTSQPSGISVKGLGKEMVMGIVIAFVAAGTIGVILGLMSKASKSKP